MDEEAVNATDSLGKNSESEIAKCTRMWSAARYASLWLVLVHRHSGTVMIGSQECWLDVAGGRGGGCIAFINGNVARRRCCSHRWSRSCCVVLRGLFQFGAFTDSAALLRHTRRARSLNERSIKNRETDR